MNSCLLFVIYYFIGFTFTPRFCFIIFKNLTYCLFYKNLLEKYWGWTGKAIPFYLPFFEMFDNFLFSPVHSYKTGITGILLAIQGVFYYYHYYIYTI